MANPPGVSLMDQEPRATTAAPEPARHVLKAILDQLDSAAAAEPPPTLGPGPINHASLPPVILFPGGTLERNIRRHCQSLDDFVAAIRPWTSGSTETLRRQQTHYVLERQDLLEHRFPLEAATPAQLLQFDGFCRQWPARTLLREKNVVVLSVAINPSFWQRLVGGEMGLDVCVTLELKPGAASAKTEATVSIRPFGCSGPQALQLLTEMGPKLLDSVRDQLRAHVQPERRGGDRRACRFPLLVAPVLEGRLLGKTLNAQTKDLSPSGVGFFLRRQLPCSQVYLNWPDLPDLAHYAGLARVVRQQQRGENWFEIGAAFKPPT